MSELLQLPVLALRDMVLFPGVTAPVRAGRPMTLNAIQSALKSDDKRVFVVSQIEDAEEVTPELLHTFGTIAHIGELQRVTGGMQLLLHGEQRGIAIRYTKRKSHVEVTLRAAEEMLPLDLQDAAYLGLQREVRERAAELGEKAGLPEEVVRKVLESVDNPGLLADLVSSYVEISTAERQKLLEILSVEVKTD